MFSCVAFELFVSCVSDVQYFIHVDVMAVDHVVKFETEGDIQFLFCVNWKSSDNKNKIKQTLMIHHWGKWLDELDEGSLLGNHVTRWSASK